MIWTRLKSMKCPKQCKGDLRFVQELRTYNCSDCTFIMNENKFNSIVENLYLPKSQQTSIDNFEALQNL
jgi:hypothetical protein